jgi:hypothetical protein
VQHDPRGPPKAPRLLDQVRTALRVRNCSPRTDHPEPGSGGNRVPVHAGARSEARGLSRPGASQATLYNLAGPYRRAAPAPTEPSTVDVLLARVRSTRSRRFVHVPLASNSSLQDVRVPLWLPIAFLVAMTAGVVLAGAAGVVPQSKQVEITPAPSPIPDVRCTPASIAGERSFGPGKCVRVTPASQLPSK